MLLRRTQRVQPLNLRNQIVVILQVSIAVCLLMYAVTRIERITEYFFTVLCLKYAMRRTFHYLLVASPVYIARAITVLLFVHKISVRSKHRATDTEPSGRHFDNNTTESPNCTLSTIDPSANFLLLAVLVGVNSKLFPAWYRSSYIQTYIYTHILLKTTHLILDTK